MCNVVSMLSRVASGTARLFGYSLGTARPRDSARALKRHDASATLKLGQSNSRRSVINIIALVVVAKALPKRTKPALFSNTRRLRLSLATLFREPCRDDWNAPAAKSAPDLRQLDGPLPAAHRSITSAWCSFCAQKRRSEGYNRPAYASEPFTSAQPSARRRTASIASRSGCHQVL